MEIIDKLIKCYFDGRIITVDDCRECKQHCSSWGYYEDGCLVDNPKKNRRPLKHEPFKGD